MSMSPEQRAKIGAGRRAAGMAFRSSVVNGRTLADLHAEDAYYADAARIMGWSVNTVANWERDTGKRFKRMPFAERNRRQRESLQSEEARMERAKAIMNPENMETNAARMRELWADPEKRAAIIAKRVATRKANPAAAEQSRRHLREVEGKRRAAMQELFADEARWGAVKAKISASARERFSDPAERQRQSAAVREAKRRLRVEKGMAALKANKLTERQARALVRDMTGEERMIWMMQQDARQSNARMKVAA